MKKTFFTCFFLGMSVLPTLSKTYDKVDVLERPVPISSIKDIKGFFGYRMEVNRNYLEDFPIDKYVDFVVQRQHTALRTTQPHAADGKARYATGTRLYPVLRGSRNREVHRRGIPPLRNEPESIPRLEKHH